MSAQLRSKGAALFYVVAALATGVSIDTSWRFFDVRLGIPNSLFGRPPLLGFIGERFVLFAVLELTLVACGVAMRANARRPDGKQGATQILAWALCGVSGYMALDLAGVVEGLARVVLGPVLGLIALHLALGIEVRVRHAAKAGTWARIFSEIRERFLSRLGLGNDGREAAERSRDRARDRAARLAAADGWVFRKGARLERAIRASGATLDQTQRARLREQVIVLKRIGDLGERGRRRLAVDQCPAGARAAPRRCGAAGRGSAAKRGRGGRCGDHREGPGRRRRASHRGGRRASRSAAAGRFRNVRSGCGARFGT